MSSLISHRHMIRAGTTIVIAVANKQVVQIPPTPLFLNQTTIINSASFKMLIDSCVDAATLYETYHGVFISIQVSFFRCYCCCLHQLGAFSVKSTVPLDSFLEAAPCSKKLQLYLNLDHLIATELTDVDTNLACSNSSILSSVALRGRYSRKILSRHASS